MRTRRKSGATPNRTVSGDDSRVIDLRPRSRTKNNSDSPKPSASSSKLIRRINLDLPEKTAQHLDWLQEETGAISTAEVIRNALKLYYGLAREAKAGGSIILKSSEGDEKEVKTFF